MVYLLGERCAHNVEWGVGVLNLFAASFSDQFQYKSYRKSIMCKVKNV